MHSIWVDADLFVSFESCISGTRSVAIAFPGAMGLESSFGSASDSALVGRTVWARWCKKMTRRVLAMGPGPATLHIQRVRGIRVSL